MIKKVFSIVLICFGFVGCDVHKIENKEGYHWIVVNKRNRSNEGNIYSISESAENNERSTFIIISSQDWQIGDELIVVKKVK